MNAALLSRLGVKPGEQVKVGAGGTAKIALSVELDDGVPTGAVRISAAHLSTVVLPMNAIVTVERA
jgi:formylmethanofuran dehydrogenase subunit D